MNNNYCTVLSKLRLYQAIAFFGSLYQTLDDFYVYTLCADDDTYNLLKKMKLKNIEPVHINELQDESLIELRNKRKLNEYCWTLKPVFLEYIFLTSPKIERLTYVDADLFFWQNPSDIFALQAESSVLLSRGEIIIPFQSLSLIKIIQELLGNYNSGFVSFKNDEVGRSCIEWWKTKCLDSCINLPDSGQFGDQKYLDEFKQLFPNIDEITTPGVNIGHWNNLNSNFYLHNGEIFVDEHKLICYHFSGFRIISKDLIIQVHEADRIGLPFFYEIYKVILKNAIDFVMDIDPNFDGFAIEEDLIFK